MEAHAYGTCTFTSAFGMSALELVLGEGGGLDDIPPPSIHFVAFLNVIYSICIQGCAACSYATTRTFNLAHGRTKGHGKDYLFLAMITFTMFKTMLASISGTYIKREFVRANLSRNYEH